MRGVQAIVLPILVLGPQGPDFAINPGTQSIGNERRAGVLRCFCFDFGPLGPHICSFFASDFELLFGPIGPFLCFSLVFVRLSF